MKVLLHQFLRLSFFCVLFLTARFSQSQTSIELGSGNILYVDMQKKHVPDHTPTGDSWENALPELADALAWAREQWGSDGEEAGWDEQNPLKIFVAKGVYTPLYSPNPDDPVAEHKTFLMVPYVEIYGGFDPESGITSLNHRRIFPGIGGSGTILSGDLNGDDNLVWDELQGKWLHQNRDDNVYQVVLTVHDQGAVIIDGVEISGGSAIGQTYNYMVDQVSVNRNRGGGIFCASPVLKLKNALIRDNVVSSMGGGLFVAYLKEFDIINSAFIQNTSYEWGGAIYADYSSSVSRLTQVTIAGNHADNDYSAIATASTQIRAYNTVILGSNNSSSILAYHSLVEGRVSSSSGNIPWDPAYTPQHFFRNPTQGDFSLLGSSLLLNAGNNDYYVQAEGNLEDDTDLSGNPRVSDGDIDIGAYEYLLNITPDENGILYVDKNVAGGTGAGDSWENAIPELADALKWARAQWDETENEAPWDVNNPLKIFVAKGTYTPLYSAVDGEYTQDGGRDNAFVLIPNVQLFGGFDPLNGVRNLNDPRILPTEEGQGTILSGFITESGERVFHVVISIGEMGSALLNGFSITEGNADGTFSQSITVRQEPEILKFGGGGMYNVSNICVEQVHIRNNYARVGAAWLNLTGEPFVKNVRIYDNQSGPMPSAWYNNDGNPTLVNVFIRHVNDSWYQANGSPLLVNSTILGNWAIGTITEPINITLQNSLLIGDFKLTTSEDENLVGYTLLNSVVSNQFYDEASQPTPLVAGLGIDLTTGLPDPDSPIIGAGNNQFYTNTGGDLETDKDLKGDSRLQGCSIDLGAFEAESPGFKDAVLAITDQVHTLNIPSGVSTIWFSGECEHLIASLTTDGNPNAVQGNVTARVWIRTEQPENYVKRNYEIAPESNPEGSTARVTLFFTNEEFQEFNQQQNDSGLLLPDADDPETIEERKANIRIEKRGGVSSDGSGDPNSYTGAASNLIPQLEDIVWNPVHKRWEISFNVEGFSGFFVKTTDAPLPLNLISFKLSLVENEAWLEWETSEETLFSHFEIEYSTDGDSFTPLSETIQGLNQKGLNRYFLRHIPESEVNYYRLKMVDLDGQFTYSRVEVLYNQFDVAKSLTLYPNPARSVINVKSSQIGRPYRIYNATGQVCKEGVIEFNPQSIDLSGLPSGIYNLRLGAQISRFIIP